MVVAGILALISCFLVHPDQEYLSYIDSHTIILLFCLMAVMAGFKELGLFQCMGEVLVQKIRSQRGIAAVLVLLCFFSSMLITNDVALIIFVPFGMLMFCMAGMAHSVCVTVILMTIAANLGSSLTPIGNPQNIYLYSQSGISLGAFLRLMFPYAAVSGVVLLIFLVILYRKKSIDKSKMRQLLKPGEARTLHGAKIAWYSILFFLCLLSVARLLNIWILFFMVLIMVFLENRKVLLQVDYSLLLTFCFFFVFIGNMGRVPAFHDLIVRFLNGNELVLAVGSSQVISNVPAALLLSGFTDRWQALIVGTNLGGLGTLIASMASLISYKQIARQYPELRIKYLLLFTLMNVIFLGVLLGVAFVFGV